MKILVKIKNDRLCFITRKKLNPDYKNMLNTNVISNNELVFSDEYIFLNQKIICTFFNELIKTYSITTLSVQSLEVLYIFLPLLSRFKEINSLYPNLISLLNFSVRIPSILSPATIFSNKSIFSGSLFKSISPSILL